MPPTKQILIESAIAILNDSPKGMEGLTVDALASHLHMSKSTLYKHFESLSDLVYETAEHACIATEEDLAKTTSTKDTETAFKDTAVVYAAYSARVPSPFLTSRHKLPAKARLRLENFEERMGSRMFQAALNKGASSSVAYGVRSAFDGLLRFTAKVPPEEKRERFEDLTKTLLKGLT